MTVDISRIKAGDEVLVRAIADRNSDGDLAIRLHGRIGDFDGTNAYFYVGESEEIDPAAIASHTPKIAVGDCVRNTKCASYPPGYQGGEVLAISGEWAMVKFTDDPGCVRLSELERI